ncbi:Ribonucleotide reductase of class Ia (aerobic),alpha subunit [Richelia intracellularis HH01]|uniref:Ribonucleoside-diphosphate reductase n=1 Tax=Richelia intracellularis HH01 TaxID=1165094 RepID=M1WSC9_9NOST|nr:ribonucleoside-diphosphate reductase subunit alpha [Richelia intracellularis]CCH67379.1 Ribonucleotide reductase of class Ia (aerobic),alpha subunit [Richelia intracellularis HH01]HAE06393.1 ribonucleoside-diphosphate reductase subunit alpha [Richelia sp.]
MQASSTLFEDSTRNICVIHRDGSTTPLEICKIRTVVNWACRALATNPIALEAQLKTRLRPGITTREIQDNLIRCALELCSPEEPDWRYVAGRLHIWSLWKDTQVSRGYQYGEYARTVQQKVLLGEYDSRISLYSPEELEIANSWINPDWDADYDYAGAVMLTERYLLANELPQEAFLTCALLIASVETPDNRLNWSWKFYRAIARRQISLATPILANLRVPNGSLASCFITAMDDNLESIFENIHDAARISKNGGGVGVNLSRIRATGSWVMGKKNASGGVVPWIKLLNDTAIAVNQGGRRAGAVTVSLDIWHFDLPEFLDMQTENGDARRKAYDVFPQLVVNDEFMRRVAAGATWTLVDPYEVRTNLGVELAELWGEAFVESYLQIEASLDSSITIYKKVNARAFLKQVMRSQLETGMPYLWFKDTANRANPNQHQGYIPGGNLCQESWSNVKPGEEAHTCNLVSINLANLDYEEQEGICHTAVRILDNTIDLTSPPFTASANHNVKYRTIGVGCMGLADWLAKRHLTYSDLQEISNLFEDIGYYCTAASMELAKERGAYPVFTGSEWSKGNLIGARPVDWFEQHANSPERFLKLSQDIKKYGVRNSHITSIAPNTSSSLVQGCTASVLPVYSRFFYEKWAKGSVPIAPPYIRDHLWFYGENKTLDQKKIVKVIATIQQWIDTGISMELLFNLNAGVYFPDDPERCLTAVDIFETIMLAWELGCKAIYYIRTVQKDSFKESNKQCVACAN